jgi:hypothetical protein
VGGEVKDVHTSVSRSKLNILYGSINVSEMNMQSTLLNLESRMFTRFIIECFTFRCKGALILIFLSCSR